MKPIGTAMVNIWNEHIGKSGYRGHKRGLIAVTIDQRNHGSREVMRSANEAWGQGNATHAQDMFSIYHGTSQDVSLLITHLPSYIFPTSSHTMDLNLLLGISLGGHATWHSLLAEPRITTGVVVIGCPDYVRLMTDRARHSKLDTYTSSSPPGRDFLGSKGFPKALVEAVEKYDPAGLLLGELDTVTGDEHLHEPSDAEKTRLRPIMRDTLGGKRILLLSGGKDKLVPYQAGESFYVWLKNALKKDGGWFNDRGTVLEDIVDESAGHEYSQKMATEAARFVVEALSGEGDAKAGTRTSKI